LNSLFQKFVRRPTHFSYNEFTFSKFCAPAGAF
jgi:hypothetical protein